MYVTRRIFSAIPKLGPYSESNSIVSVLEYRLFLLSLEYSFYSKRIHKYGTDETIILLFIET